MTFSILASPPVELSEIRASATGHDPQNTIVIVYTPAGMQAASWLLD
jgi:hypothetical protein